MWSYVSPTRPHTTVIIFPKSLSRRSLSRARQVSATDDTEIGALDHTILKSLQSNPKPQELKVMSKPTQDDQISGSDLLWAMKKVADKKTKRRKKENNIIEGRELLPSAAGSMEEFGIGGDNHSDDDDNARPLVVKRDWAAKLAELEIRLNELCHTK